MLTANNGIGYYQFFTCFFIASTALILFVKERSFHSIKRCLFALALVVLFSFIALLPFLIVTIKNGGSETVMRSLADGESYGLKIAQFFIPINDHGSALLAKIIDRYNANMPLVNENRSAYLGIGGIVGFLLSLLILISRTTNSEKENELHHMSKLIVFAILYASIGGFSSLIAFVGFQAVRSFNRISIYIMFMSISIRCLVMQRGLKRIKNLRNGQRALASICVGLFSVICLFDVWPAYADNRWAVQLENNKRLSEMDRAFINEIDNELQSGDMVYQLPYHKYAEAGAVRDMPDYYHFIGNLYSDDLKWSFGGVRDYPADRWNEYVSGVPMQERLGMLISTGFRGIYIDKRAYSEEGITHFCNEMKTMLNVEPIVSENGALLFYSLYPYIEAHPEVLDLEPLEVYNIEGRDIYPFEQLSYIDPAENVVDKEILHAGSVQFGPYTHLEAGKYRVSVHGENLDVCDYNVAFASGAQLIPTAEVSKEDGCLIYDFETMVAVNDLEMRLFNNSSEDVILNYLEIQRRVN